MAVNVDFTQGAVNSFNAGGSPTYSDDGVYFTVSQGGDAPQLASVYYIMFGRVEVVMKAAPGAGIVSSLVLQSDTLDEIDIEWLGAVDNEIQTNYFGKGNVVSYNRGQFHEVSQGTQGGFVTYTIDWTEDRIIWMVDGTAMRELKYEDAEENQYPQTPMQVKFGSWAGGDPDFNADGTVEWAQGPTDYTQGPFSMVVQSIAVTDYSTGSSYQYTDNSGSWESIEAVGGEINGNKDEAGDVVVTASAEAASNTADAAVPTGIGSDDAGDVPQSDIPDGWRMTEEGKLIQDAAAGMRPSAFVGVVAVCILAFALN